MVFLRQPLDFQELRYPVSEGNGGSNGRTLIKVLPRVCAVCVECWLGWEGSYKDTPDGDRVHRNLWAHRIPICVSLELSVGSRAL